MLLTTCCHQNELLQAGLSSAPCPVQQPNIELSIAADWVTITPPASGGPKCWRRRFASDVAAPLRQHVHSER